MKQIKGMATEEKMREAERELLAILLWWSKDSTQDLQSEEDWLWYTYTKISQFFYIVNDHESQMFKIFKRYANTDNGLLSQELMDKHNNVPFQQKLQKDIDQMRFRSSVERKEEAERARNRKNKIDPNYTDNWLIKANKSIQSTIDTISQYYSLASALSVKQCYRFRDWQCPAGNIQKCFAYHLEVLSNVMDLKNILEEGCHDLSYYCARFFNCFSKYPPRKRYNMIVSVQ